MTNFTRAENLDVSGLTTLNELELIGTGPASFGGNVTISGDLSVGSLFFVSDTDGSIIIGDGTENPSLNLNSLQTQVQDIIFKVGGVNRWVIRRGGQVETGSDTGSAFQINARNDAGADLGPVLTITRAAGGAADWTRPIINTSYFQSTLSGNGSSSAFQITAAIPSILISESDQGLDGKNWELTSLTGELRLRLLSDVYAAGGTILNISRSGSSVSGISIGNSTNNPTFDFLGTGTFTVNSTSSIWGAAGPDIRIGSGTGNPTFRINSAAGTAGSDLSFQRASIARFIGRLGSATESGGNAGSPMEWLARDDAGAAIDTFWSIVRASGGAWTNTRPAIFTSSGTGTTAALQLVSASPSIRYSATGAGTNEKEWGIATTTTQLLLRTRTDAQGTGEEFLNFTRSGVVITGIGVGSVAATGSWLNLAPTTSPSLIGGGSPTMGVHLNGSHSVDAGSSATLLRVRGTITEAASGNHSLISGTRFEIPTITSGAATVTNTATVYVAGAPTATVTGANYAFWVASGSSQFDAQVTIAEGVLRLSNNFSVFPSETVSIIGSTANAGGAYPYLEAGNLVIAPRTSGADRDIVFYYASSGGSIAGRIVRTTGALEWANDLIVYSSNSFSIVKFSVDSSTGDISATSTLSVALGTITNPKLILDTSVTWNDGADTFTGWKLNVTDTDSGSGSAYLDFQSDTTTYFKVLNYGHVHIGGSVRFIGGNTEHVISASTADASDNHLVVLTGGGDYGLSRGSAVISYGNEYSGNEGDLSLAAGIAATSGKVRIQVGDLNGGGPGEAANWEYNGTLNQFAPLVLSSTLTGSGDWIFTQTSHQIKADTSDGSDNKNLNLWGGGGGGNDRGAAISLYGNELGGNIVIQAGNTSGANIDLNTGSGTRMTIYETGEITVFTRFRESKGSNATAANDLTLGVDGNYFVVTGNTTINGIDTADWIAGSMVTLEFTGTPTVKHNTAASGGFASLKLSGAADFSATADDTLTLRYNGTFWMEVARTVI